MNAPTAHPPRVSGVGRLTAYLGSHRTETTAFVLVLASLLLALDFAAPHYIEFSVTYAVVIAFATQFVGWPLGTALAFFLPLGHLSGYFLSWQEPYPLPGELLNVAILLFVGIATVYLIQTTKRLAALRQENIRLETLRQTMITVNDIVLNRLQVMQYVMHLAEQEQPLPKAQAELGRAALDEVVVKLRELSTLEVYETAEVTAGVEAVVIPDQPTS